MGVLTAVFSFQWKYILFYTSTGFFCVYNVTSETSFARFGACWGTDQECFQCCIGRASKQHYCRLNVYLCCVYTTVPHQNTPHLDKNNVCSVCMVKPEWQWLYKRIHYVYSLPLNWMKISLCLLELKIEVNKEFGV